MKRYVVAYMYVAPLDARIPGEPIRTQFRVGSFETVDQALDFVSEYFDGAGTFDESFRPEAVEAMLAEHDEYFGDDYSAGQWFKIINLTKANKLKV